MKTKETLAIEQALFNEYCGPWQFGVHEVTIGLGGSERVDFLTISTHDVVRCFEIKVSKSDLNSKAKLSFCGNYNYLVAPKEIGLLALESEIIPSWVGVMVFSPQEELEILRAPAYKEINAEALSVIKSSLIRSMSREINKSKSNNYNELSRDLSRTRRALKQLRREHAELKNEFNELRRRERIIGSLEGSIYDDYDVEEIEEMYASIKRYEEDI